MYNTTLNQMKSTEEKKSFSNFDSIEQLSMSKEDNNSKSLLNTMNFWGRGSHYDELNFFELNNF